jgi:hypothetical protein
MTINRGLDQSAIDLINLHFSVIPTNGDKKATISWKEFQTRMMTTSEALILKKKPMNVIRTRYKVAICQGAWICNCIFNYIHPATVQNRA